MKKLLFIFLTFILLSCSYDKFPEWSGSTSSETVPNAFIENIAQLATSYTQQIMTDHTVKGTVVSSDKEGNFYKSIFIDDGTSGLEIMVGLYDMYNLYPVGSELIVSCEGLYIMKSDGVTQLGEDAGSSVGYFSHKYIANQYISVKSYDNTPTLTTLTINELNDGYCGRLIKFCNLYYNSDDYSSWANYSSWTGYYSDTYRTFSDALGNELRVLTSGYADFVGEIISTRESDLCGILFCDSEGYYIKLRYLSDVTVH